MWRRASRIGLNAGWVVVLAGWLVVAIVLLLRLPLTGSDFGVYLAAAQALHIDPHANIYQLPVIVAAHNSSGGGCPIWGLPYLYQPLLALLLEPLAALPCAAAWYLWQGLNLALWAGCAAALAGWARGTGPASPGRAWLSLLVAALTLTFLPLIQGLTIGQIHVIILAICLGGARLVCRDRPALAYLAGALLGFGAVIKYFPLLLILYYLLRGKWRVAAGAAVAIALLLGIELLVVGPRTLSASFVGVHYAATLEAPSTVPGGMALAALAGVGFVAGVLLAGRARRFGAVPLNDAPLDDAPLNDRLGVAWALATILLVSPLVQWEYLTWLLPAVAVCLSVALDARSGGAGWRRWGAVALIALAYVLMLARMVLVRFPTPTPAIALTSIAGAILVWGLCGAYYLRSAGAQISPFKTLKAPLPQTTASVR